MARCDIVTGRQVCPLQSNILHMSLPPVQSGDMLSLREWLLSNFVFEMNRCVVVKQQLNTSQMTANASVM